METQKPISFKIFTGVLISVSLVVLVAALLSVYDVEKKYQLATVFVLFLIFTIIPIGIYEGYKYTSEEQKLKTYNKIGLFGNCIIYLAIMSTMLLGAVLAASR